jgi:putative restriction endonuclease
VSGHRAWSLLAVDGTRQYGGNTGYDDDPSNIYRYNSDVANHLQLARGDVVIVRSKAAVLGIAEVERIVETAGTKTRLRCPQCGATNIKRRLTMEPAWGCKRGHHFDEPVNELVEVRTFEAHYGSSFRRCASELTLNRLLEAVLRPSDQMSIKEIDLGKLEAWIGAKDIAGDIVKRHARSLAVPEDDDNSDEGGVASIIEERRRVLREIQLRRGQKRFRERLIRRYGAGCQISRCSFPGLIEAAHIRPYARSNDNSVTNGVLLRSDLHTLFDLGLLGIEPVLMTIALHPATLDAGYRQFERAKLFLNGTRGPDEHALRERWEFFQAELANE